MLHEGIYISDFYLRRYYNWNGTQVERCTLLQCSIFRFGGQSLFKELWTAGILYGTVKVLLLTKLINC